MKIDYARVSTADQSFGLQLDALKGSVAKIFIRSKLQELKMTDSN